MIHGVYSGMYKVFLEYVSISYTLIYLFTYYSSFMFQDRRTIHNQFHFLLIFVKHNFSRIVDSL